MGFGEAKTGSNISHRHWVKHLVPKLWTLTLPGNLRSAGGQGLLSLPGPCAHLALCCRSRAPSFIHHNPRKSS